MRRNVVLRLGGRASGGVCFAPTDVLGIKTCAVMFGRPQPARGLVGQGHGGRVVALALGQRQRPLLGSIQRLAAFSCRVRGHQHRARRATSSTSAERLTLSRIKTGLPAASTPCRANTFFAKSMPRLTMVLMLLLPTVSVEMRGYASHRGIWLPKPAKARHTRDGEVPFIR